MNRPPQSPPQTSVAAGTRSTIAGPGPGSTASAAAGAAAATFRHSPPQSQSLPASKPKKPLKPSRSPLHSLYAASARVVPIKFAGGSGGGGGGGGGGKTKFTTSGASIFHDTKSQPSPPPPSPSPQTGRMLPNRFMSALTAPVQQPVSKPPPQAAATTKPAPAPVPFSLPPSSQTVSALTERSIIASDSTPATTASPDRDKENRPAATAACNAESKSHVSALRLSPGRHSLATDPISTPRPARSVRRGGDGSQLRFDAAVFSRREMIYTRRDISGALETLRARLRPPPPPPPPPPPTATVPERQSATAAASADQKSAVEFERAQQRLDECTEQLKRSRDANRKMTLKNTELMEQTRNMQRRLQITQQGLTVTERLFKALQQHREEEQKSHAAEVRKLEAKLAGLVNENRDLKRRSSPDRNRTLQLETKLQQVAVRHEADRTALEAAEVRAVALHRDYLQLRAAFDEQRTTALELQSTAVSQLAAISNRLRLHERAFQASTQIADSAAAAASLNVTPLLSQSPPPAAAAAPTVNDAKSMATHEPPASSELGAEFVVHAAGAPETSADAPIATETAATSSHSPKL